MLKSPGFDELIPIYDEVLIYCINVLKLLMQVYMHLVFTCHV